jgi:hypothetical protein
VVVAFIVEGVDLFCFWGAILRYGDRDLLSRGCILW